MAPSIPLLAALLRLSDANLDEQSMLQMPVVEKTVQADASDCACPGYYEAQCRENEFQGCMWTDAGNSNAPWCQCDPDFVYTPPLFGPAPVPPAPPPAPPPVVYPDPRYIRPIGGTAIYWEVSGVKFWVRSCSMCDETVPSEHTPCNNHWVNVEQSYIDSLQTGGGYPGSDDGTQFECAQHPQYTAPPPANPQAPAAVCPEGWEQKGEIGADIGGCGLQSCDQRYDLSSEAECAARCDDNSDCLGFSYSPMNGDRNHPGVTACTIYNRDIPTGIWTGTEGIPTQVFCDRVIQDLETADWIYSSSHRGMYLAGHAAGDSTIRSMREAAARCDVLGDACAGITCRSEVSCTVRAGSAFLESPSGEFSFKKDTPVAPVERWILIARQDASAGGYFDSSTTTSFLENADNPEASTYMIAGQDFSDQLSFAGKYHFRLVYTGDSPSSGGCRDNNAWTGSVTMEWLQSSWVTDTSVAGFEDVSGGVISAQSGGLGCEFHGLAKSSTSSSVLDGSPSHGNWWNSVGGTRAHEGAIPAFRGRIAQTMALYVRSMDDEVNPHYSPAHAGVYLSGHAFGDSTIRPLQAAQDRCDELGSLCAGVTCRSETSCTVRAGHDLRASPSGEFSHVKETQTASTLVAGDRYSAPHVDIYLSGHAAGDSTIGSVSDRTARCDELGDACAGITCRSATSCTVRAGRDLRASPSNEVSFVKEEEVDAWILIAHQDVTAGYFASSTASSFLENADDAMAGLYMIAGQDFSEYRHDGKYHLRLVYTGDSPSSGGCRDDGAWTDLVTIEWLQSSWVTATSVTGFEDMSDGVLAAQSGGLACEFHGLAKSSTASSVLDGSPSHGNWWNSVGATRAHEGAIPAFRGRIAETMSLYLSRY